MWVRADLRPQTTTEMTVHDERLRNRKGKSSHSARYTVCRSGIVFWIVLLLLFQLMSCVILVFVPNCSSEFRFEAATGIAPGAFPRQCVSSRDRRHW